jgi:FtsP/CotA-like multicopper oxidase with cupredoxin domain
MDFKPLNRRSMLRLGAAGGAIAGAAGALPLILPVGSAAPVSPHADHASPPLQEANPLDTSHPGHSLSATVGDVDVARMGFDPSVIVRTFDYGEATRMADGTTVREWEIAAYDKEIEIAPGVFFPAWTYNGQVPGPTLRANEGDRLRIHFTNAGTHPHTMHFHGIHSAFQDGVTGIGRGEIQVGEKFVYEFEARPFGCHLYHCHSTPLKRHIHKGLYGAYIVNPDPAKHGDAAKARHPDHAESEEWQEFVMVMNAFDTTFDAGNEVYAVNSVAFHYMKHPIEIDRTRPVRIYLVNVTEFDLINSFHLHANFFDYYDPGTRLEPTLRTVDTIMQAQGQRGILEFSYKDYEPGLYMFHAHVSEFAELGWMGVFDVR